MGRIISVASGKGGAGKSTVAVQLAVALSKAGNRVLLVDTDCGMRCLDLMLGLTDQLVFDFSDVLSGNKTAEEVICYSEQFQVFLLPAPSDEQCNLLGLKELLVNLCDQFDFVLVDLSAGGLSKIQNQLPRFSEGLVVCNPEPVALRNARQLVQEYNAAQILSVRLVLNRVNKIDIQNGILQNIDDMIDYCGAGLIAIIPNSRDLYLSAVTAKPLQLKSSASRAFTRFAKRICGYNAPFAIRKL